MAAVQLTMIVRILVLFPEHLPIPLTEALRIVYKVMPGLPSICELMLWAQTAEAEKLLFLY